MWGGMVEGSPRGDRPVMVKVGPDFIGMMTQQTSPNGEHLVPTLDAWDGLLERPKA